MDTKYRLKEVKSSVQFMADCYLQHVRDQREHGYLLGAYRAAATAFKQVEFMLDGLSVTEAHAKTMEWLEENTKALALAEEDAP